MIRALEYEYSIISNNSNRVVPLRGKCIDENYIVLILLSAVESSKARLVVSRHSSTKLYACARQWKRRFCEVVSTALPQSGKPQ